jgi:hypothetical protein
MTEQERQKIRPYNYEVSIVWTMDIRNAVPVSREGFALSDYSWKRGFLSCMEHSRKDESVPREVPILL